MSPKKGNGVSMMMAGSMTSRYILLPNGNLSRICKSLRKVYPEYVFTVPGGFTRQRILVRRRDNTEVTEPMFQRLLQTAQRLGGENG